ncbi:hypothetical protein GLOTRDRAFT_136802 [Gloeophyllum trabeum ATCC 11539]|uniref:F-box domain-containing protein n=1 Tax=Gloeophyllum trabeum (strain ATCC 11539 / FP-39264 / Madison 617) TaxID=670483 RepID=S7QDY3_GLOTA|nr:uncharacterized protein GLOTRDRAFT_136802 [Gloeophyllum trabeum ATCC 11539]EPQ57996.1 hypothetical protein GLOTRDRAFT_136802 [Gloeophyllum trabeum ATCC 11539]
MVHRALLIQEVAGAILDNVPKKDLVAVARTCHDLTDLALDRIWHEIPDLRVLISVLPESLFKRHWFKLVLSRELHPAEWERLQYYIPRITSIKRKESSSSGKPYPAFGDSVLAVLGASNPLKPFLPNLVHLDWSIHYIDLAHMCMFLGPRVQDLRFGLMQREDFLQDVTILEDVAEKCPSLKQLLLGENTAHPDFVPHLSRFFSTCQNLERLDYRTASPNSDAICALAELPCLRQLELLVFHPPYERPDSEEAIHKLRMLRDRKAFRALKYFCLYADLPSLGFVVNTLQALQSSPLEALQICVNGTGEADPNVLPPVPIRFTLPTLQWLHIRCLTSAWRKYLFTPNGLPSLQELDFYYTENETEDMRSLVESIAVACSRSVLTSLKLDIGTWNDHNESRVSWLDGDIPSTVLWPFLAFENMTHFLFTADWPLLDPHAMIQGMASSWKELKTFYLIDDQEHWDERPGATSVCLAILALHCRKLETISLRINALEELPMDLLDTIQPNESVRLVDLGDSPGTDSVEFLSFFQRLFPNARRGHIEDPRKRRLVFYYPRVQPVQFAA